MNRRLPYGRRVSDEDLGWDRARLTVVIPVFNEKSTVETLLRRVREVLTGNPGLVKGSR